MTNKLLWSPSNVNTNLTKFKKKYFNTPEDCTYEQLHKWSVEKKDIFWDILILVNIFMKIPILPYLIQSLKIKIFIMGRFILLV